MGDLRSNITKSANKVFDAARTMRKCDNLKCSFKSWRPDFLKFSKCKTCKDKGEVKDPIPIPEIEAFDQIAVAIAESNEFKELCRSRMLNAFGPAFECIAKIDVRDPGITNVQRSIKSMFKEIEDDT